MQVSDLGPLQENCRDTRNVPSNTWLFDESRVYAMLLKGRAPQSEPFRKWVTEEVLPTIRKTGRYDASESSVYEMLTRVYWAWRGYKLVIGL
ncbi:Bro-N domain-containing protein [Pseudomonas putida]|uniref:BRO-N domain-containing protein n=1 Tax=Pseudomonas putida TaxID=303 RepID=UPI003B21B9C0